MSHPFSYLLPRIWQTPSSSSLSRENHGDGLSWPQPEPCFPGRRQVKAECGGVGPNHSGLCGQGSESLSSLWDQYWKQLLVVQHQIWRCNWYQGKKTLVFSSQVNLNIYVTYKWTPVWHSLNGQGECYFAFPPFFKINPFKRTKLSCLSEPQIFKKWVTNIETQFLNKTKSRLPCLQLCEAVSKEIFWDKCQCQRAVFSRCNILHLSNIIQNIGPVTNGWK